MTDEYAVLDPKLLPDLDDVGRISIQATIFLEIVGGEICPPGADMVERHHAKTVRESRHDVPSHVLIAAEPVGEQHRLRPVANGLHVVAIDD
jgi:hypothetical protein